MATAVVTGANRGLGLEFVRQLSAGGWQVEACCRTPERASDLAAVVAGSSGRVRVQRLDMADAAQIEALAARLQEPIDLLINNAGIIDDRAVSFSEGSRATLQALGHIPYDGWEKVLRVNVIAPMRLTEALLGRIAAGDRPKIVMISSIMGSLAANDPDAFPPGGGIYVYRSSKAALNMVARTLAADLKSRGIAVLALNPGWVKTDMGGSDGMFAAETSVANMLGVIERSTLADTGSFISHDGKILPW